MEKNYVVLMFGLVLLSHASYARNIPTKNALAPIEEDIKNVVTTTNANAPVGNGVGDEKNFITYGGMGGWAGIGGYGGVGGGLGGLGGAGGLGGLGGVGGAGGGLGGLGGGVGVGGGVGGAGGIGGIIP